MVSYTKAPFQQIEEPLHHLNEKNWWPVGEVLLRRMEIYANTQTRYTTRFN
jgi:hypothetical protein